MLHCAVPHNAASSFPHTLALGPAAPECLPASPPARRLQLAGALEEVQAAGAPTSLLFSVVQLVVRCAEAETAPRSAQQPRQRASSSSSSGGRSQRNGGMSAAHARLPNCSLAHFANMLAKRRSWVQPLAEGFSAARLQCARVAPSRQPASSLGSVNSATCSVDSSVLML